MALTIPEIMQGMPEALIPEKAAGVNANVQLDFSADGGGMYVVHIADGKCDVREGQIDQPNATMTTSAANYIAIVEGRLDGMKAFMTGQLKVKGDLALMMKFQQMFDTSKARQ